MTLAEKLAGMEADLELITSVVATVPNPAAPFAAIALGIEKIFGAALKAHSLTSGKTVQEIVSSWKDPITPV